LSCFVLVVFVLCLCSQCCQCLWIVHSWLPPRFPLTFICLSSSCVLYTEDCQCLLIVHSCLPPRFSLTFICLSSSCVMCADGCQCLWIVHSWLPPRFSLTFICLSSSCVLYTEDCQCLWIVHSWLPPRFSLTFICLSSSCVLIVWRRLPMSLDCPFLIASSVFSNVYLFVFVLCLNCVPSVANVSGLSILDCLLGFLKTQDEDKQINVRENRGGNQEWTIQRHW
jgi:hypothetical protein